MEPWKGWLPAPAVCSPRTDATANFIHFVQRAPVRIALRENELQKPLLRPGLPTVTPTDIRDTGQSPNAALTETSAKEYETDIFGGDLANAKTRAGQIIESNLVPKCDLAEPACPAGQ